MLEGKGRNAGIWTEREGRVVPGGKTRVRNGSGGKGEEGKGLTRKGEREIKGEIAHMRSQSNS